MEYFKDFEFSDTNISRFEDKLVIIEKNVIDAHVKPHELETISIDDLLTELDFDFRPQDEIEQEIICWDFENLYVSFINSIRELVNCTSQDLTLEDKDFVLVEKEQLKPQTEDERAAIIERYGEYISDGGIGDCTLLDNGRFMIRIGYGSQEKNVSELDVLEVMAHEFGHTLGDFIEDPIFEELKAYTFESLFMQFINSNSMTLFFNTPNEIHDIAISRLNDLIFAGVCEEAILAHLIKSNFGTFSPDSYKQMINK